MKPSVSPSALYRCVKPYDGVNHEQNRVVFTPDTDYFYTKIDGFIFLHRFNNPSNDRNLPRFNEEEFSVYCKEYLQKLKDL